MTSSLEKYIFETKLGDGALGEVHHVRRVSDNMKLVIKKMHRLHAQDCIRDLDEVFPLVSGPHSHPNVVEFIEYFSDEEFTYVVYEYVVGEDLVKTLASRNKNHFTQDDIYKLFAQLMFGLQHLHERNLIHRDLKPESVMVTSEGVVKLIDFVPRLEANVARELTERETRKSEGKVFSHLFKGQRLYRSPEVWCRQPYTQKSDMWSCGCILYELITRHRAFSNPNRNNMEANILKGAYPPIRRTISEALQNLVAALLHVTPDERPSTVEVLDRIPASLKQFVSNAAQESPSLQSKRAPSPRPGGRSDALSEDLVNSPRDPSTETESPSIHAMHDVRRPTEAGLTAVSQKEQTTLSRKERTGSQSTATPSIASLTESHHDAPVSFVPRTLLAEEDPEREIVIGGVSHAPSPLYHPPPVTSLFPQVSEQHTSSSRPLSAEAVVAQPLSTKQSGLGKQPLSATESALAARPLSTKQSSSTKQPLSATLSSKALQQAASPDVEYSPVKVMRDLSAEEKFKQYDFQGKLSKGFFGELFRAIRKVDDELFMARKMNVTTASQSGMEDVMNECNIMEGLHHPNVVEYIEHFIYDGFLYIIMDYVDGVNLKEVLANRKGKRLIQREIQHYFTQITAGVSYLHSKLIVHRNIKPSNLVVSKNGDIKILNFGLAVQLRHPNETMTKLCGTPLYIAPEMFNHEPYTMKVDVWMLGCVLYELMTLERAFYANTQEQTKMNVLSGAYPPITRFFYPQWNVLLTKLLHLDPSKRPNSKDILEFPVMQAAFD